MVCCDYLVAACCGFGYKISECCMIVCVEFEGVGNGEGKDIAWNISGTILHMHGHRGTNCRPPPI